MKNLHIETDVIDVTSLFKADPNHHIACCCGEILYLETHQAHRIGRLKSGSLCHCYCTTVSVVDPLPFHSSLSCPEGHTLGSWECTLTEVTKCIHCGALLKGWPTVSNNQREFIQGPATYYADGIRISKEEYNRIVDEIKEAHKNAERHEESPGG